VDDDFRYRPAGRRLGGSDAGVGAEGGGGEEQMAVHAAFPEKDAALL
jgi:hypothetical protein